MAQMTARDIAALIAMVGLGAGLGSFGQTVVNPPRPDPFTGEEAREMEKRLLQHFDRRLQLEIEALRLEVRASLIELRSQMPPEPTRNRIESLEQFARDQDELWRPPTSRWSTD